MTPRRAQRGASQPSDRLGGRDALLVVDIQHGFIDALDELPVPGASEVIPIINRLLPLFGVRAASQDWHPPGHGSFASRHPGAKPFELGELGGVQQIYWPDHCVAGTRGAAFHPELETRLIQAIFRKGMDPLVDSYSVFNDNARRNPTGLQGYLANLRVRRLAIAGLALDYCVRWSGLDAIRLLPGVEVIVVVDACRPVSAATGEEALREMERAGVRLVTSTEILR